MSLTLMEVFEIISARGSAVAWAVVKGAIIWGGIGLALAIVLYMVGARFGWVDIRGRRQTAARVCYGLILFLVLVPLVATSGVVHELGDNAVSQVREDVRSSDGVKQVGAVLVGPLVVAHVVLETEEGMALAQELTWNSLSEADMVFLASQPSRERVIHGLTDDLVRLALDQIPGYAAAREEAIRGFLLAMAERQVFEHTHQTVQPYAVLFRHLEPDADGRLTFAMASETAAMTLFGDVIEPMLRAPFQALRLQLIIAAVLALVLGIALIQGVGRFVTRPERLPPASDDAAA